MVHTSRIPRSIAWLHLPIGKGYTPKVCDVVHLQNGTNRVPRRKGLVGDLHQQGEALGGQIAQVGEETSDGQVYVDPEGE